MAEVVKVGRGRGGQGGPWPRWSRCVVVEVVKVGRGQSGPWPRWSRWAVAEVVKVGRGRGGIGAHTTVGRARTGHVQLLSPRGRPGQDAHRPRPPGGGARTGEAHAPARRTHRRGARTAGAHALATFGCCRPEGDLVKTHGSRDRQGVWPTSRCARGRRPGVPVADVQVCPWPTSRRARGRRPGVPVVPTSLWPPRRWSMPRGASVNTLQSFIPCTWGTESSGSSCNRPLCSRRGIGGCSAAPARRRWPPRRLARAARGKSSSPSRSTCPPGRGAG